LLGRAGIKYKEGSKTFYVDSEMEVGPYEMVIYKKRVRNWESPIGSYEEIDDKKKNEIVENIRRALLFQGRKIEIEESY
jgi:hypothetical protein